MDKIAWWFNNQILLLGVFLKIKFCKTLYMLDPSFFVSVGSNWVRIITEHEHFYVKKLKWKKLLTR